MLVFEYVKEFWINELSKKPKYIKNKYNKFETDDKMIIRYAMNNKYKFDNKGKKLAK